ncbi:DUF4357 domain-containing protein [Enterococcus sp. BWB1-3]|nr:DUF4357 domain-containing protein [Enterococcus sp. BWB1-3]
MEVNLKVKINEKKINIQFEDREGEINIIDAEDKSINLAHPAVYFLLKDNKVNYIGKVSESYTLDSSNFNKIIVITPPWEIEPLYLEQLFLTEAKENKLKLVDPVTEEVKVPANQKKAVTEYKNEVLLILEKFGYSLQVKKAKPAKASHRWTKAVSQIEFYVDSRESKATVLWQKRNEMVIKAGAILKPEGRLNKDGSIGMDMKFGDKLRDDHKEAIKDFKTTEDVVLKSVNEAGLFLYYGGTNGWLEMKDSSGKTIDEWTKVD